MGVLLLSVAIFLLVSSSPYQYWDEYFYLFSLRYHTPGELLEMEPGLSIGLFPPGFFSAKLGFVVLVRMLVQVFGDGYRALLIIQSVFAMLMVGFIAASYGLLREILEEKEALHTTVVLIFLPISVYLGYKVLSEVPSLLFITLGSFAFLRSFQAHNRWQLYIYLLLSTGALCLGVICRFVSVVFFASLILGLLVLKHERYYWKDVFIRASIVSLACLLLLMITWTITIGLPIDHFSGLIMNLAQRSQSPVVKLYTLVMSVQFFLLPLLFSVRSLYNRTILFALVWAGICTLPFLMGSQYLEPRFLYMALVPLAILTHAGLQRLTEVWYLARYRVGKPLLLAIFVLGNWWGFASLMPYEIDQHQYAKMMSEIKNRYQTSVFLIPWLSDYCFLRFAFPEQQVKLSLSTQRAGHEKVFQTETFHRWVGSNGYMDSLDRLTQLPQPWIYVGWTYNPVVLQLKKRLDFLGINYLKNLEQRENLMNHLTRSWVWSHPHLTLRQVAQVGPYYAFKVQFSP